jgi:hypothetical protein
VEEDEEGYLLLYTAKSSGFIYVVQLFDNYALVRSATPDFYHDVHKIDLKTFYKEFDEYCGDHEAIHDALFGYEEDKDIELLE